MATSVVLYALFVVAILGAVPAADLAGFQGTALTPLGEVTGPLVVTLGAVYALLAMGLSSLHKGLGLYNQVGEWLPRAGDASRGRLAELLSTPGRRAVAKALPVVALLLVAEGFLLTGTGSFTEPLAFTGTVIVPFLSGLFPMLLLIAARRRGELVPASTTGVLARPWLAGSVAAVLAVGLAVHVLFIWDEAWQQITGLVAMGAMVAVPLAAVRGRAFRRRLVVELRVDPGRPEPATASVVAAGERVGLGIEWDGGDGSGQATDVATLGVADRLTSMRVAIPTSAPRDVRTWVHRVDDELESVGWRVDVVKVRGDGEERLRQDEDGFADDRLVGDGDVTIEIRRRAIRDSVGG
jgi:hypothetical protein